MGRPLIKCLGCGFNVEEEDVGPAGHDKETCETCKRCEACPDMRESFRRGFNEGVNSVRSIILDIKYPHRLPQPPKQ